MTTSVLRLPDFTFQPPGRDEPVLIRMIMMDGEPWFVGADVLRVLFGTSSGKSDLYSCLTPARLRKVRRADLGLPAGRYMMLISEAGLYRMIMKSNKPEAAVFQAWVTDEVLPAIRKTGGYLLNEAARETAHADTRTEMPLPAGFGELLKANLAMAELLAQAVRAQRS